MKTQAGADALERAMIDALRSAPPLDRGAPFPRAWWQHLAERRLLGLGVDLDGQGARAGWPTIARLAGCIARETASLGAALGWLLNEMQGRFVLGPHARADVQRSLLRRMVAGEAIVGLAISEPGVGAHPKKLCTSARREGDRWLLDGRKSHVSHAPAADAFVVVAVTGEHESRKRFDAFVVEANAPGLTLEPGGTAALPPLEHAGLVLNGCAVADAARLTLDGAAFDRIAKPVRIVEDALLAGAIAGAMRAELAALAPLLRGAAPAAERVRGLGALKLELDALDAVADRAAERLESEGPGEALAAFNAGARRLFERWQAAAEAFAAQAPGAGEVAVPVARDLRTVLGIARSVGEMRQYSAGTQLIQPKETDEVAA